VSYRASLLDAYTVQECGLRAKALRPVKTGPLGDALRIIKPLNATHYGKYWAVMENGKTKNDRAKPF
jgi:hypothetical protein